MAVPESLRASWVLMCREHIINQSTKNASAIEILHTLRFQVPPDFEEESQIGNPYLVNLSLGASVLHEEDEEWSGSIRVRFEYLDAREDHPGTAITEIHTPDGAPLTLAIKPRDSGKFFIAIDRIPFLGSGAYNIHVELGGEEDWASVGYTRLHVGVDRVEGAEAYVAAGEERDPKSQPQFRSR